MKLKYFTGISTLAFIAALAVLATSEKPVEAPNHPPAAGQPANVFLTDDESNNIAVFRDVSPSVVFVTNTLIRRQLF